MDWFLLEAKKLHTELVEIRRELHRFPELSWQEFRTTQFITEYLTKLGIEVVPWGRETGVVGILRGAAPGEVVALRADIDALPILEENDVCYRSEHTGKMHACGHDLHTACLLGCANILAKNAHLVSGTVKFIFQPAEEQGGGANAMVESGVLLNPPVSAIFGLHNQPDIPVGSIGLKEGPLMAANNPFSIKITGQGGHGAIPHKARDPITAAGAVIQALQTIIPRKVAATDAAVISFGTISGGTAGNVIPDVVEITGTTRASGPEVQIEIEKSMRHLIEHVASAFQTEAEFDFTPGWPAVINPRNLVSFCRESLEPIFGMDRVIQPVPTMATEDFSLFQQDVPGVLLWLGVGNAEKGFVHPWHNSHFDLDEDALSYGTATLAKLACEYLKQGPTIL